MLKAIAVLLLVAVSACNRPPASAPAASASPAAASSTAPAPSGITASSGGGTQVVDPQASRRGTIATTRTR